MDLERLDEALERVHHNEAWPMGLNTRVALGEVCEAARAYRDGERVEWCETHNAEGIENHGGSSDECWRVVWAAEADQDVPEGVGYPYDLCRIVSKLLIDHPLRRTE